MLKQVLQAMDLLDHPQANGEKVAQALQAAGECRVEVKRVEGEKGSTDFIKVWIPGSSGKASGGEAPTLGVVGRLGGVGARPQVVGLVSDADGAVVALSTALKLVEMAERGDRLRGDVVVATHVCPNAPIKPHQPVPFMGSPVDIQTMNREEVDPAMEAVLSVDTTRGNRVANWRGFAITPTVKEGWVLKASDDLLDIYEWVTGEPPKVCPITTQDITPYGNGLYHINSIMQPATVTTAPVVGVALTTTVPVPGCATGASQPTDIEAAARFCVEVAKRFGEGGCRFYDPQEWETIERLYGAHTHLQSPG